LRGSFSSKQWRKDARDMLYKLIDHIENSDYSNNIIGYHLAAGNTEEWFHFGYPLGGFGDCALEGYRNYLRMKYNNDVERLRKDLNDENLDFHKIELPRDYKVYEKTAFSIIDKNVSANLLSFLEYQNWIVADAICYFAKEVKEKIQNRLVVGAFYGYINEAVDARCGHHFLKMLLNDKNIDFLCSPNSYSHTRAPGIDWANMSVLDSVKSSGKLWVSECDTRTWLTRPLREARPSICPKGAYEGGVWEGPKSKDVSKWLIRKCFARNIITGTGYWWFDMWGGWFDDKDIMKEMSEYIKIQNESLICPIRNSINEVAVIVDEEALKYLNVNTGIGIQWNYEQRIALGWAGAPYDIFDIKSFDINDNNSNRYKLIIFLCICEDKENLRTIISEAKTKGINLCFTYLPGVIKDGYLTLENVSDVTGIKLKQTHFEGIKAEIAYSEYKHPLPKIFEPLLVSDDEDAITLAYFCESDKFTDNALAAVSMKKENNIKIFYSSIPNIPAEVLRGIYRLSGVHIYIETNDVIYVNHSYLAIHSSFASQKNIKLPEKRKVIELIDDGIKINNTEEISIYMEKYQTRLFRII